MAEALGKEARKGHITCRQAHDIAKRLNLTPAEVGMGLDLMELRIARCQLGLFGYTPDKKGFVQPVDVPPQLEREITGRLPVGRLSCLEAWEMAARVKCARMTVGAACDAMEMKIGPCQLGAF